MAVTAPPLHRTDPARARTTVLRAAEPAHEPVAGATRVTGGTRSVPRSLPPRRGHGRVLAPLLLAAVVLAGWELATRTGAVDTFFLPAPTEVFARVWSDLTGPALSYAWPTLQAAVGGSLLALAVAVPLGVLVTSSAWARTALEPYIAASQALPAVAVAPLLVLWLGYGLVPVMVLCALMVFFPILVSTVHGLTEVDRDIVAAARVDGASGLTLLRLILLPLALPAILSGMRNGFTISITGAIVGEIVTGGRGMGLLLSARAAAADATGLFSVLVLLGAAAITVYIAIGVLQHRLAHR